VVSPRVEINRSRISEKETPGTFVSNEQGGVDMSSRRFLVAVLVALAVALVLPGVAPAPPVVPPVAVNDTVSQSLARFVAGDRAAADEFGYSIAVSGNTAVVGARYDDHDALTDAGAAYVFTLVSGVWTQQAKLVAGDAASNDRFGTSVAIDGNTILVGASYDDTINGVNSGSVYIFDRVGTNWSLTDWLKASDGAVDDLFGSSVSISGDWAAVGAYGVSGDTGEAYVFERISGVWWDAVKLTDATGAIGDRFGRAIAISGDTMMVGAPGLDPPAAPTVTGKVCVFTNIGPGWAQGPDIAPAGLAIGDRFGGTVLLTSSQAVVGAWGDMSALGFTPVPAFYRFARSGASWTKSSKSTGADGPMNAYFGSSVAFHGDSTLVGMAIADSSAGAACAYGPKLPLTTPRGTPLSIAAPGVLVNDYDLNGLSVVATQATTPVHGTVALAEDGGFLYTPGAGFSGDDTFTYKAWNGYQYSGTATATIAVTDPVWRFRNNNMIGNYLWTPDPNEKASLIANLGATWTLEGPAFQLNPDNPVNDKTLWRFRNKQDWTYFYTADLAEKADLVNNLSATWDSEGPAWDVSLTETPVPVWRFRCLKNSTHLWTSDPIEKLSIQNTLQSTYALEGIAYWLGQ
jgi:hypothetical protein